MDIYFLEFSSATPPYLVFRQFFSLFTRFLLEITSNGKINCLNTLIFCLQHVDICSKIKDMIFFRNFISNASISSVSSLFPVIYSFLARNKY